MPEWPDIIHPIQKEYLTTAPCSASFRRRLPCSARQPYSSTELIRTRSDSSNRNCRNDRRAAIWEHAKLNGADFRAVGNEPGWHMEISNKHDIVLVFDYGQSRFQFENATITASPEDRRTSYLADNGTNRIEVILLGKSCQDTMADEDYETTVTVILDERELNGCGRPLH